MCELEPQSIAQARGLAATPALSKTRRHSLLTCTIFIRFSM